jgi:hypothetical protein
MKHLIWRVSILAGVLAAAAGGAAAQTTNCSGTLAPGGYDGVNVPAGATCTVNSGNVDVTGNVTVGSGASLFVFSPAKFTVNSSLLSAGARIVQLAPQPLGATNILGSVSLVGTIIVADVEHSFIGGTLSVANSNATSVVFLGNNVAGNVLVQNNKTSVGPNDFIASNTIGGSLVCSGNTPPPTDAGLPNTVGGSKVGQCGGL